MTRTHEPNTHPESYCHRCGGPNSVWFAPSPLWNAVMRGGSISGTDEFDGIVCPTCFMVLAEERGIAQDWRLDAHTVHVELETRTPDGRIWDRALGLWRGPGMAEVCEEGGHGDCTAGWCECECHSDSPALSVCDVPCECENPERGSYTGRRDRRLHCMQCDGLMPTFLCKRCKGDGRLIVRNEYSVDFDVSCPDCDGKGAVA